MLSVLKSLFVPPPTPPGLEASKGAATLRGPPPGFRKTSWEEGHLGGAFSRVDVLSKQCM